MSSSHATVVDIGGKIAPGAIPQLCEYLRALLEGSDAAVVVCNVSSVVEPDAVTIEALARLQLTARQFGRAICLVDASDELRDLLALAGLADVVPCEPGLGLGARGQPEKREQSRGVEEEREPGDPTV